MVNLKINRTALVFIFILSHFGYAKEESHEKHFELGTIDASGPLIQVAINIDSISTGSGDDDSPYEIIGVKGECSCFKSYSDINPSDSVLSTGSPAIGLSFDLSNFIKQGYWRSKVAVSLRTKEGKLINRVISLDARIDRKALPIFSPESGVSLVGDENTLEIDVYSSFFEEYTELNLLSESENLHVEIKNAIDNERIEGYKKMAKIKVSKTDTGKERGVFREALRFQLKGQREGIIEYVIDSF